MPFMLNFLSNYRQMDSTLFLSFPYELKNYEEKILSPFSLSNKLNISSYVFVYSFHQFELLFIICSFFIQLNCYQLNP